MLISQIYKDSPADKYGLKRGDVIVEMDGKPVKDVGHFRNMIALTLPGTDIDLIIIRKGKSQNISVKLSNISEATYDDSIRIDILDKLGIMVQNLTEDEANKLGYDEMEGVLISNVKQGSLAAFLGLRPGMLILEVNKETVKRVSELSKALES